MEDSFEILQPEAADSLTLPLYNRGIDLDNLKTLCDSIKVLDTSVDKVSRFEEPYKQKKIVKWYDERTAKLASKNEEMRTAQIVKENLLNMNLNITSV